MHSANRVFFTHLDNPKLEAFSELQRAVYNGRTDKARRLIAADHHNIYQPFDRPELSLLYVAIARDHRALADDILAIYEQDFRTIERFHAAAGFFEATDAYGWVRNPVLVACGAEQVAEARRLCADVGVGAADVTNAERDQQHDAGLVVLCKQSNTDAEADVIWCTVRSAADVPKVARLIGALYAGGCLRFHTWPSVMALAVQRNCFDLYVRMHDAWGRTDVSPEMYLQHMLEFGTHCAADADPVAYFEELLRKFGTERFVFLEPDGRLAERRQVLIDPLSVLKTSSSFVMFEWMMRRMAEQRQRAEGGTMQANLTYVFENPEDGRNFFENCIYYNLLPEALQALSLGQPDVLSRSLERHPILLSLISDKNANDPTVVQCIVERYEEMRVKDPQLLREICIALVEHDWSDALRALYSKYADTVKQFVLADDEFRDDCDRLLCNIDCRLYGAVEFLLSAHREQFGTAELVGDFIWHCALQQRAAGALEVCLQLPGAAMAGAAKGHALYVALSARQRSNYHRIRQTVDTELLRSYRDENTGDSLLHAALWRSWASQAHGDVESDDVVLCDLELVDSDDDETSADRKRQHNIKQYSRELRRMQRITDANLPDQYSAEEQADYEAIFQELIDAGCDMHAANDYGETVFHRAIGYGNVSVLAKLLGHDVPHAMLQRQQLLTCDELRQHIAQANATGRTVLHRYVETSASGATEAAAFVEALLEAGADVHARLDTDGNTALHLAVRSDANNVLAALLAGGADVNARNAIGETPFHHMFKSGELIRLADDQIDWLAVSDAGVSLLPALIRLGADETTRLSAVFDRHTTALRRLFAEHSTSLDSDGLPGLYGLCTNLAWTQRFVGGLGDGVDAQAIRLNFVTGDAAERLLAQWMIGRGVNFACLADEPLDSRYGFTTAIGWNMLFELGAQVRFDAEGRANALRNDRLRQNPNKEAVEAIAQLVLCGADIAPLCEDHWPQENVWIYDSLMNWYHRENEKISNVDCEESSAEQDAHRD